MSSADKQDALALRRLILRGEAAALDAWLRQKGREAGAERVRRLLHWQDELLMPEPAMAAAAGLSEGPLDILTCLHAHGAEVDAPFKYGGASHTPLRMALGAGRLDKARWLVAAGAHLRYSWDGYTALLDAIHHHDVRRDEQLLATLQWLIDEGVDLNSITSYGESGLRVLSRLGRFDAVTQLVVSGADAQQLGFTPLHWAVAAGTLDELRQALEAQPELAEQRDRWSRTPLLLSVQTGDVAKFELLRAYGADMQAAGRCGKTLLQHAVDMDDRAMLTHLLGLGLDMEQTDDFGHTALTYAAQERAAQAVDLLLRAGAVVDGGPDSNLNALYHADCAAVARRLLDAGASPAHLTREGTRAILGFRGEDDRLALDCTEAQIETHANSQFASRNGQDVTTPYKLAMIRSGVNAYLATKILARDSGSFPRFGPHAVSPVWCANRFGQSLTFLPDGRIVQIGGEHEDGYDPDFCIYNDVFVHLPDGDIRVHGYPKELFPPTDFHTATLIGTGSDLSIIVIGCLGYPEQRRAGHTPVYRLRVRDWTMQPVTTRGDAPGWLYKHAARQASADEIEVWAGQALRDTPLGEAWETNSDRYLLHLPTGRWRREPA